MVTEGVKESFLCQSIYCFMNATKWKAMDTCVSGFSFGGALDIVKSQGFYGLSMCVTRMMTFAVIMKN